MASLCRFQPCRSRQVSASACMLCNMRCCCYYFFFNDTATTEIYTLSLHDALPILSTWSSTGGMTMSEEVSSISAMASTLAKRSEEHTSELQSQSNLVCRLLLEKKKIVWSAGDLVDAHEYCSTRTSSGDYQSRS